VTKKKQPTGFANKKGVTEEIEQPLINFEILGILKPGIN
jgi:hypothetical protein